MPYVTRVEQYGSQLSIVYDDGSRAFAYPSGQGIYLVKTAITDPPDTGGSGGGGSAPPPSGSLYNPWANQNITGTWLDHTGTDGSGYSAGGIDYPLAYGTAIKAPASGTLHTSGGSGEYAVGWVGSAGRRSILYLDEDFPRQPGKALEVNEGSGNLHAIVFQHQSVFGTNGKHYNQGDTCGKSGASANGQDYGGDVHLHVHGLTTAGERVDLLNFVS